ncbi:MAG: phosphoglycerate kinase [Candidatus Eisenbacteria bacterium]|uniref:Phosphoglycerate kinase n=1 Tax=Eiseniibacteriota bacterium TaxID=2212470 RepID=A0A7Y2E5T0_UNCEI|nr:phosphoglycerate kinase [Candidatus Eisenbacteria bacterium]
MNKLTLDDLDVAGKRVLMRVDFNVPIEDNRVADETRIRAAMPTIQRLRENGARVVLMSHLGRPKGEPNPKFTLEPVARRLARLLDEEIRFVNDCVGDAPLQATERLGDGDVLLLENLRYHPEEEANDAGFSHQLSQLGDIYVNDAFGTAHRAHASTVGVTKHFKQAAAGLLMEAEIHYLTSALAKPGRPFVAILGGAKISGKVDVIENLLDKVDCVLVGGGMTYTFYKALGIEIGDSLLESDRVEIAKSAMEAAEERGVELVLPADSICSAGADGSEPYQNSEGQAIPLGTMGVDIGSKTIELFRDRIESASTVIWNGPVGIFEVEAFSQGTLAIAKAVAEAGKRGATTVVGGGDSVAAIGRLGLSATDYSHVSTGGGAFLEFLEGKDLPGLAALTDKGA